MTFGSSSILPNFSTVRAQCYLFDAEYDDALQEAEHILKFEAEAAAESAATPGGAANAAGRNSEATLVRAEALYFKCQVRAFWERKG